MAVRYLHSLSIAHLDISLENICVDSENNLKLIDFGLAAQNPFYRGDRRNISNTNNSSIFDSSYSSNDTTTGGTTITIPSFRLPRNSSRHIRLLKESDPKDVFCFCKPCSMQTEDNLLAYDYAILSATICSGTPIILNDEEGIDPDEIKPRGKDSLFYLCRPICNKIHKPGKLYYMSHELYMNYCWDAYANDNFAVGVIM